MSTTRPSLLIVEDDQGISESLRDLLTDEGYEVRLAQHGRHALEILQGGYRPATVLLDYMMPVMDGLSFLHEIRADSLLHSLKVVVMSAGRRPDVPPHVPILSKPIQAEDLLALLPPSRPPVPPATQNWDDHRVDAV